MIDLYALQMQRTLERVTEDAAVDVESDLLLENLSLEIGRQQRLARVQQKREELGLPNTLKGRTKALEELSDG